MKNFRMPLRFYSWCSTRGAHGNLAQLGVASGCLALPGQCGLSSVQPVFRPCRQYLTLPTPAFHQTKPDPLTVKPPYLPYGKKRKLSLSSFKNDLFILHLCRNCLFWRLPSQCFQLFQVCMDLPLCIKLIVVFCPKILIFHTVFQDMINRY